MCETAIWMTKRPGLAFVTFLLIALFIFPTLVQASSASNPVAWANGYFVNDVESTTFCSTAWSIIQTSDRGYVVAGDAVSFSTQGLGYGACGGASRAWVLKLDSTGGIVWQKTYGEPYNGSARAVEQTADGGYVVAGRVFLGTGNSDAWVFKLDQAGNIVWQRTFGGPFDDGARSVQQTSDGGYVVAGFTAWTGIWYVDRFGDIQGPAWLFKLDSAGNMVWQKTYGDDYLARSVKQTSDGGFV